VLLQPGEERFLVDVVPAVERLQTIDQDREGDDEAEKDGVHAPSTFLEVLRQRLEHFHDSLCLRRVANLNREPRHAATRELSSLRGRARAIAIPALPLQSRAQYANIARCVIG